MQKLKLTKKYEKYPEYKDSGVEWIGKIPKGWNVATSRRLFITTKDRVGSEFGNYKILSLTLHGVIPRVLDGSGKNPAEYDTYQVFNKNDLVFCLFDYDVTPRTIGYVEENGMMTGAYTRLIPQKETFSRYYYYYFLSLDFSKELLHLCTGLRNSLSKPVFWSLLNPFPPADAQEKISDYLDQKTSYIDRIIEKKQKMIELLKEKRTAVINHTVIRGLNPKAELVESGVEWIGKIPKGWKLDKVKRIAFMNKNTLSENTPPNFSFKYFDIGSVDQEEVSNSETKITFESAPSRARRIVNVGDSIIATVRTYLKAIAYFDKLDTDTIASTGFAVLTPKDELFPKYLFYYIQSDRFINQVIIKSKGVGYPAITPFDLGLLEIIYPDITTQKLIVSYLDEEISRVSLIIEKIEESIVVLREFKSSLISNIVTGKTKI